MTGPRRWRDDPDVARFDPDVARALKEESLLVDSYDLGRVRAGVDARLAGKPGPGGGGGLGVGAVAAGLGLAAVAVLALWSAPSDNAEVLALIDEAVAAEQVPAQVTEPVTVAPPVAAPVESVPPVEPDPVRVEPDPVRVEPDSVRVEPDPVRVAPPVESRPEAPEPVAVEEAPVEEGDAVAIVDEPAPEAAPAPQGQLGLELAAIRAARAALDAGDPVGALRRYHDYLYRWPDGHLHQEASVGVLESFVALENWEAAARFAGRLANTSELAPRRSEFLRVRADALVRLGRCDEALEEADLLESSDASALAQRCRRAR